MPIPFQPCMASAPPNQGISSKLRNIRLDPPTANPHDRVIVCTVESGTSMSVPLVTSPQSVNPNIPPLRKSGTTDSRGMITTMSPQEVNKRVALPPPQIQTVRPAEAVPRETYSIRGGPEFKITRPEPTQENLPVSTQPGIYNLDRVDPPTLHRDNDTYTISDRRSSLGSKVNSSHSESKIADSKEFNRILKKTKPPTFSGGATKGYLSWKNSVNSEVSSLIFSPDQWYELLTHRTTGRGS